MSFAPETEKLVNELIQAEYKNACEKFGEKYHSLHEGYAVLLEEVEEAIKNMNVALPEIDFSSNKTLGELEEEICTKNKGCHNCKHDKEKIESIKEKYKNGVTIEHINTMLGIVK